MNIMLWRRNEDYYGKMICETKKKETVTLGFSMGKQINLERLRMVQDI